MELNEGDVSECSRILERAEYGEQLRDLKRGITSVSQANSALETHLANQAKAQGEVYSYLHKRIEDNHVEIAKLERQVAVG